MHTNLHCEMQHFLIRGQAHLPVPALHLHVDAHRRSDQIGVENYTIGQQPIVCLLGAFSHTQKSRVIKVYSSRCLRLIN